MLTFRHLGVWKHGEILVVRFGEHRILDEVTIEKIGQELYGLAERKDCRHVLLNFAGVERLSSLMLGKLLMLNKKLRSKGGQLKLCEIGPEIQEVVAATHLDRILDVRESEAEALKAFA